MAATINRDGQEQKLEVETIFAADTETIRVITWSGVNLHAPHLAVCQRVKEILSRVYIASVLSRPPAQLYGLPHGCFIPEANNVPTLDLSVFKSVIQNGRPVLRIKTTEFHGKESVKPFKSDNRNFPLEKRIRGADGWQHTRTILNNSFNDGEEVYLQILDESLWLCENDGFLRCQEIKGRKILVFDKEKTAEPSHKKKMADYRREIRSRIENGHTGDQHRPSTI
ncbi:hypothetical protein PG985_005820 [Apiospora marii]|uniref:uncharacterized protein n=1 Tax=Apiospora marii TaxID=335849 RepID=UPI00312FB480